MKPKTLEDDAASAFYAGVQAYRLGAYERSNPYSKGDPLHKEWQAGFDSELDKDIAEQI